MTSYLIVQLRFTEIASYRRYQAAFPAVFARFDAQVIVADESPEAIEGAWSGDKVVVLAFRDRDEAKRFLSDPEYAAIAKDRLAGAESTVVLVDGYAR